MENLKTQETEKTIDWQDAYLRLYADFDNFKKRYNKEKLEIESNTKLETLSSVLEIDNDLNLSLKFLKDENSINAVKIIIDKLSKFLKSHNIEEVQTNEYDEDIHEVVSVIESDKKGIVDVVSKGYKMNNKIVKYPKIILSK